MNINIKEITNHCNMIHSTAKGLTGKIVLCSYGQNPETGEDIQPKILQFAIGDYQTMATTAAAWAQEQHRNVYAPLAVLKEGIPKRGKLPDYSHVLGVCADFDDENAGEYLNRLPVSPSLVIGSSAGRYQAMFIFDKPMTTIDAKPLAEALQTYSGCDACTKDVIHVWRVAGCKNWPNKKKVAEGRCPEPQAVTIVEPWLGNVVSADELPVAARVAPPPPMPSAPVMPCSDHDWDAALAALATLDPNMSRSDWLTVGMALASSGRGAWFDAWFNWSQGAKESKRESLHRMEQRNIKPDGAVTLGSLFHMAKVETHADVAWVPPDPLTVMEYPPEPNESHMPPTMWDIIREVSVSRQASTSISFPTALACACTVSRGKMFVTRCDDTQTELVTLYTSSVAGSGEGKSSTRAVLEAPCGKVAKELAEASKERQAVYLSEAKAAAGRTKSIEKSLIDCPDAALNESDKASLIANQKVIENKPQSGLLICSEITPEGLVDKMQQHGFVAVLAGEGASVVESFSKYSSGDSQDTGVSPFLSAYDNERAQSARRGDASYGVDHARACLSLALQPYALQKLWCNGGLQGRGFINRLTIIVAKPTEVEYHRDKKPNNHDALRRSQEEWQRAIGGIALQVSKLDGDGLVKLSEQADDAWADFAQQWQPRVREGGDLWHLKEFFKKRLPAQVLRIAAIYHAIEGGLISTSENPATISLTVMQKAINAGELIAQHFISISKGAGFNPVTMRATAVLARIHEKGLTEITAKVLYDNGWAGITTAADAREVIEMLVEHNYMHRVDQQHDGKGRPPAPMYLINPLAAKNKTLTAKPAKPAKIENEQVTGIKTGLAGLAVKESISFF